MSPVEDVVILDAKQEVGAPSRDELKGLMGGLLVAEGTPTGETRLVEWLEGYGDSLGRKYESEIKRHYPRDSST